MKTHRGIVFLHIVTRKSWTCRVGERTRELAPRPHSNRGPFWISGSPTFLERNIKLSGQIPPEHKIRILLLHNHSFTSVPTCILKTAEKILDARMPTDLVQFGPEGGTENDVEDQR